LTRPDSQNRGEGELKKTDGGTAHTQISPQAPKATTRTYRDADANADAR
jgi:hypothetical protein